MKHLSQEMKSLVHTAVETLGEVIRQELGSDGYRRIEKIRREMGNLRQAPRTRSQRTLEKLTGNLKKLSRQERHEIATAFALMLEIINICENAYRSHRLEQSAFRDILPARQAESVIYVLTAHPTEARSPENIFVLHQIQNVLLQVLRGPDQRRWHKNLQQQLKHLLLVAWRTSLVRNRAPKVKDEAEHIYSLLFREGIFETLLEAAARGVPLYMRTWVGGDKDGHPGVDEKTLLQSLTLSRRHILQQLQKQLLPIKETLNLFPAPALQKELHKIEKNLPALRRLRSGDGDRLKKLRRSLRDFGQKYQKEIGSPHPAAEKIRLLFSLFPALVVPLELRESSDVLMEPENPRKPHAIDRMLRQVAKLCGRQDPRWYARGFIISMAESLTHVKRAAHKQRKAFGDIRLPIIPLFEESSSLKDSPRIVRQILEDPALKKAIQKNWGRMLELMVGYSDSSKEAGVLSSRLAIARTLPRLEKICRRYKVKPIFFHGSGGSTDRGGGSIESQTAWWPATALRNYKVTVQGEMVERSLATPQITRGQLDHILSSIEHGLSRRRSLNENPHLDRLAFKASEFYREAITSPAFLRMVEEATPYSYLRYLKMGSRPAKRTTTLTVAGLRAIPWILCWTQTRILFPTWWGLGSAWEHSSTAEKKEIKKAFHRQPAFQSYIKAVGFTLAKVELPVWHLYLQESRLSSEEKENFFQLFSDEYQRARRCFKQITGQKNLTYERPWLGESIALRSAMIHPLNVLQILAEKDKDVHLLRISTTGISSGMLTTG
jgi:phosphoenolpyruvate carboxylase